MGRGWKGLRKRNTVRFPWTLQTVNVLLEHFWKSSPSSAAEFRAELLCSIPGCLKQSSGSGRGQQQQRGEGLFTASVLPRVLCACVLPPCVSHPRRISPVGTGHVDSEAAVGASLCTQLGITHLLKVLSFTSLLPNLGLQKHAARIKPRTVFVP